jgi:hypothetical protein
MPAKRKKGFGDEFSVICGMDEEFVRHIYSEDGKIDDKEYASTNTQKHFIGKVFGKMLISEQDKKPTWNKVIYNTVPWGGGCNGRTKWQNLTETNRVEYRFWFLNANEYKVVMKITMWTNGCEGKHVFLRTMIEVDGSTSPTRDEGNWVFVYYFTPTADEMQKNNNSGTFKFKVDIIMRTK